MRAAVALCSALALITACTTTDEIIIDRKGVSMVAYEEDLADCRGYAEAVETGEKGARGAASSAVVGGAVGAILGGPEGAARGAGVGAVTGGARGVSEGEREEMQVVKRCLRGRGYRVLN
ncbi:MAG: glycine zipper family protein [Halioglobus sp.]|nr:glycine zipper family protein [Halioglobus sp.]